jgi:NADH:ubiquinone oxidoreductase subunit 3 (subunit A)
MIDALLEILIIGVVGAAVAVVGFRIGMLIAPRITRRTEREEGTDDRTE